MPFAETTQQYCLRAFFYAHREDDIRRLMHAGFGIDQEFFHYIVPHTNVGFLQWLLEQGYVITTHCFVATIVNNGAHMMQTLDFLKSKRTEAGTRFGMLQMGLEIAKHNDPALTQWWEDWCNEL